MIENILLYVYVFLMIIILFVSVGTPVNRGQNFFRLATSICTVYVLTGFFLVIYFCITGGFLAEELIFNKDTNEWDHTGIYNANIPVIACAIIGCALLVPIAFRPFDFLHKFGYYTAGFVAYMFFMPTMINIMQPYSVANLHDVSWGNRPDLKAEQGNEGLEAFATREEKQERLKANYQWFRTKFVLIWVVFQVAIVTFVVSIETTKKEIVNSGEIGIFEDYAFLLIYIVMVRGVFAAIFTLKWQIRYYFVKSYRVPK